MRLVDCEPVENGLVERDAQLHLLDAVYAETVRGQGRVVAIAAAATGGKTATLQAAADRAAQAGATVLSAVASRAERALQFGVIRQLLRHPDVSDRTATLVSELLDSGERADQQADLHDRLCEALLTRTGNAPPLVICVDDVEHADDPSVRWLLCLLRRLHGARVLVLVSCSNRLTPPLPQYRSEVHSNPHLRVVQLEPLTRHGVAEMLRRAGLPELAEQRAEQMHDATGGNPLLMRALIEDCRRASILRQDPLPAGWAFGQAVLTCLDRSEPMVAEAARAVAVLGRPSAPPTLGRFLGLEPDLASRALELLGRAGVLDDEGQFRHQRARDAVLAELAPQRRSDLHRRAAELLHEQGETAGIVAAHLRLAGKAGAAWMPPTLHEASELALANDDIEQARGYLQTVLAASPDQQHQAEARSRAARLEWLVNPAGVLAHLPDLLTATHHGTLPARHAVAPVNYLLWYGRANEAVGALQTVCGASDLDAEVAAGLRITMLWMAYAFPDLTGQVGDCWRRLDDAGYRAAVPAPPLPATASVSAMVALSPHGDAAAVAEQVTGGHHRPADESLAPVCVALAGLVLVDRFSAAGTWYPPIVDGAARRTATTWSALHTAVRAELSLHHGDLPAVRQYGRQGLTRLPHKGWGIGLGSVLATLVRASTAGGANDEAAHYLGVPVLPGTFSTRFGLQYLRARGRYYLATNRAQSAVDDFQSCGALIAAWGVDEPAQPPWRTDLAQAHLALGECQQARELAQEQLRRLGDHRPAQRGITLRVLASASDPTHRVPLLREAVELLQSDGDRLEAVQALVDLSDALHRAGESSRARMMARNARIFARKNQALPLLRRLQADGCMPAPISVRRTGPPELTELSDAERRVAALAALGHTNREIAERLYVTVSTVEQHLTRVYRKLRVNGRSDLPPELHQDDADHRVNPSRVDFLRRAT